MCISRKVNVDCTRYGSWDGSLYYVAGLVVVRRLKHCIGLVGLCHGDRAQLHPGIFGPTLSIESWMTLDFTR